MFHYSQWDLTHELFRFFMLNCRVFPDTKIMQSNLIICPTRQMKTKHTQRNMIPVRVNLNGKWNISNIMKQKEITYCYFDMPIGIFYNTTKL